ncbi:MAG: hypothetical protein J6V44_12680 [Methanobrevibacter sp.]|nr:hypothetical protein [Methanobrevibacter sp.]
MFKTKIFKNMEIVKLCCYCCGYPMFCSINNQETIDYLNLVAKYIADKYSDSNENIIKLTFTGSSGAIACGYVLNILHTKYNRKYVELCNIRKEEDRNHHDGRGIPIYTDTDIIIIVDDFISTGNTVEYLIRTITQYHPNKIIQDVFSSADLRFVPEDRLSYFNEKIETIWIGED